MEQPSIFLSKTSDPKPQLNIFQKLGQEGSEVEQIWKISSIFCNFRAFLGLKVNFFIKFLSQLQGGEGGGLSEFKLAQTQESQHTGVGVKGFGTGSLILHFFKSCLI